MERILTCLLNTEPFNIFLLEGIELKTDDIECMKDYDLEIQYLPRKVT